MSNDKQISENELEIQGYKKQYSYTQYSHDNHVNIMPEKDFYQLTMDTFATLADNVRHTYGPYGNSIQLSVNGETTITKDGHNVFQAIGFSHRYKDLIRDTIYKICDRVNRSVGDGTTSCILLAEKMFKVLAALVNTTDRKRNLLPILEEIEAYLHNPKGLKSFKEEGLIRPLTKDSLTAIIQIASNYDHSLTELLTEAFDAKSDEHGNVEKLNNVTIKQIPQDYDSIDSERYSLDFLPGQYRTQVYIDDNPEFPEIMFGQKRKIKVLCYNYSFNIPAWELLMQNYDKTKKEEILIISCGVNADFLDTAYTRYLNMLCINEQKTSEPALPKICFVPMTGLYMKSRIEDLAALLGTELRTIHSGLVDFDATPVHTVQLYKDAMCFFNLETIPEKHIETLKREIADDKCSATRALLNKERIRALQLNTEDSIITVTTSSSLEAKILGDKITDCISIVRSAYNSGVIPNLLKFGYSYVNRFNASDRITDKGFVDEIRQGIMESIRGLFLDIWNSKYQGTKEDFDIDDLSNQIYSDTSKQLLNSYDIISDNFIPFEQLSTSTNYDIEVISAAISIVKYMLDSRAFVFDARLMGSHGDTGEFVRS